jgi:hypothetical protein
MSRNVAANFQASAAEAEHGPMLAWVRGAAEVRAVETNSDEPTAKGPDAPKKPTPAG